MPTGLLVTKENCGKKMTLKDAQATAVVVRLEESGHEL
jgi:hypothetical protein